MKGYIVISGEKRMGYRITPPKVFKTSKDAEVVAAAVMKTHDYNEYKPTIPRRWEAAGGDYVEILEVEIA